METAGSVRATWSTQRAFALAFGVLAVVAVLDQVVKWLIVATVMQPPRVIEVTGFFNIVLTYNSGISFGLLRGGDGWMVVALIVLALAVVGALLRWLWRQPEPLLAVSVGLVCGGAVGNALDRIHRGAVVDFLDFHLGGWHWPAFNLADSAITVGVALLLIDGLFRPAGQGKN